ncbi:acetylglutamate kinase [Echinicola jeungdonensis]|uniref:Acetylglutamate kinase n=1 Tax=Echinicola jeungdonensis TaxID=709343 RepID=A0ABV5J2Z8_9BACT|nr:acetylglutamate kinase [Echinicola jeungdonensis]MDN3670570.1 acetylglutamate kinase [Echinicola jeungdonensis]
MVTRKVLIKYGGNAMTKQSLKYEIAKKVKELQEHGIQVVLVHGGGPFINKALESAGIASQFYDGQRHTTEEALSHIEKTLKGEVNSSLVGVFNQAGLSAVGLSGKDGQMVTAVKRWHYSRDNGGKVQKIDLGQVGDVKKVDCSLLRILLDRNYIPIITCIASDLKGDDYNINADVFAGKVASALQVDDYIVLTDVDGVFENYPDPKSILKEIHFNELDQYYNKGIQGGMIPKIESCKTALQGGVKRAIILNGTQPEQIIKYILGKEKIGTTITK